MKRFRNMLRRPPRTIPGTSEEILSFLDAHGTEDKDRRAAAAARYRAVQRKRAQEVRVTVDLHGLSSDQAERRILAAVESCGGNTREILLIHGRGRHSRSEEGPVLKTLVHHLLDGRLRDRVRRFRPGTLSEGGEGATVVFLR
jgi:DNA-nicking Smr family endonuclease